MDIATVQTADKRTFYMTLLSAWGMVADIDIESEKLRRIGDSRFVFGMYIQSTNAHEIETWCSLYSYVNKNAYGQASKSAYTLHTRGRGCLQKMPL